IVRTNQSEHVASALPAAANIAADMADGRSGPDCGRHPRAFGPGPVNEDVEARSDVFSATAARTSAFNALSSILSSSWKSMARRMLPSRLELKRFCFQRHSVPRGYGAS